jgi:hypothetical protein
MNHPGLKYLAEACVGFVGITGEHGLLRERIDRTRLALSKAAEVMDRDDWQSRLSLEHMTKASDGLKKLERTVSIIEDNLCAGLTEIRQSRNLQSEIWEP